MNGIELDVASFSRALNLYVKMSEKAVSEELNIRMKYVIINAIKLTRSADPAKIRAYMRDEKMMYKLVPGKGIKRSERAKIARKILGRALSSVKYIKAGYYKGGQVFGTSERAKIKPGKSASRGWGKRASVYRLVAEVANAAFGAEEISSGALQAAINTQTDKMMVYIWDKLEKGWGR